MTDLVEAAAAHTLSVDGVEAFSRPQVMRKVRAARSAEEANREDEIRRAYVRWVHKSFSKRGNMPVGEALLAALEEHFGCD